VFLDQATFRWKHPSPASGVAILWPSVKIFAAPELSSAHLRSAILFQLLVGSQKWLVLCATL